MKKRILALFLALGVLCLSSCKSVQTVTEKQDFEEIWTFLETQTISNPLVSYLCYIDTICEKTNAFYRNDGIYRYGFVDIEQGGRIYIFGNRMQGYAGAAYRTKALKAKDFSEIKEGTLFDEVLAIEPGCSAVLDAKKTAAKAQNKELNGVHFWLLLDDGLMRLNYKENDDGRFILTKKSLYEEFVCWMEPVSGGWRETDGVDIPQSLLVAGFEIYAFVLSQDLI